MSPVTGRWRFGAKDQTALPMTLSLSLIWLPRKMSATIAIDRDQRQDECIFSEALPLLVPTKSLHEGCDTSRHMCFTSFHEGVTTV